MSDKGAGPVVQDGGEMKVMPGWRVGHLQEEATKSGLLVPAGSEKSSDALALVDVRTGHRFWAVPSGAWRFLWPETNRIVVAVRESQIIAEVDRPDPVEQDARGQYL